MTVIHGSYSMVELGALIVWFSLMKCAAMDLDEMNKTLGQAVVNALVKCEITIAEACQRIRTRNGDPLDEAQFRKALKGEGYRNIALNHLIQLGPLFMAHLTAELMWLTAKQRAMEIVETVSVRKSA